MLHLELLTLLLALTRCAVRAAPRHERDIHDAFDPLKSVASELFGFTTAFEGPDSTGQQTGATVTPLSTSAQQSSAASVTASSTQSSSLSSTLPQTAGSTGGGNIAVSGTVAPVSTGGGSSTGSADLSSSGTVITASASTLTTLSTSSGGTGGVVPTTTGGSAASTTGTNPDSSSVPGSGASSGGGSSGSGSGSGSDSSPDSISSQGLSPGEIAAAVILPILALLALLFLLFRFNKSVRERYSTWRQQSVDRSAYRRGLDHPVLPFGTTMRQQKGAHNPGLGVGDVDQLLTRPYRPLSFGFSNPRRPFPKQPRKPLNWDATRVGGKTISAIGMAVPMPHSGQHSRSVSEMSEESDIYGGNERPASDYQDARSNQVSPGGRVS